MTSRRRVPAFLAVVGLFFAASVWAILHAGEWLTVEDPLAKADVIVVLSGSMPQRAIEAARLYRENYAPRVWVSRADSPVLQLEQMHIPYVGEEFYNQRALMALGVPVDAIHILDVPSSNTEEEVDQVARDARSAGLHTVVVVTSMQHTRRTRYIWKKRVGSDPRLIVHHIVQDSFDPAHWWRTSGNAMAVVREFLGLANAAVGFPAKPQAHQ